MKYEEIKKLMDDMGESKVDSLQIEFPDGTKISMMKNISDNIAEADNLGAHCMYPHESTESLQNTEENLIPQEEHSISKKKPIEQLNYNIIKSPMVGTFYKSSSPSTPAFVKVGDKVKKGDTLCIIEAMKLMNEIESEFDGEVIEICTSNEQMVEYGMPLFKIK